MKITKEARKKVNENLAYMAIDLNKSPLTVLQWAKKRPYMFLKRGIIEVYQEHIQSDNIDDLFVFESEQEKETLLKKYRVKGYEQATKYKKPKTQN